MKRRSQHGQALPEFALIAPLFFILIFGVIQLGILLGGQIGLTNAAREVARYASTVGVGQSDATIDGQAIPVLRRSIPAFAGINPADINVSYCHYANPTNPVTYSWKVIITIRYGHTLFVPLVGAFIDGFDGTNDNKYTTTAREEMKVETQPLKTEPTTWADCGANP